MSKKTNKSSEKNELCTMLKATIGLISKFVDPETNSGLCQTCQSFLEKITDSMSLTIFTNEFILNAWRSLTSACWKNPAKHILQNQFIEFYTLQCFLRWILHRTCKSCSVTFYFLFIFLLLKFCFWFRTCTVFLSKNLFQENAFHYICFVFHKSRPSHHLVVCIQKSAVL